MAKYYAQNGREPKYSARNKAPSTQSNERNGFKFDPMKSMHLWTMWRIGNTEKIVNFTKYKTSHEKDADGLQHGIFSGIPYGSPALLVPPLARNIQVTEATKQKADELMHVEAESPSELKTGQFIYYGLPRVVLKSDSPHTTPR